ncbi:PAS domain-containing protein [Olivibacter sp. SDN3]|uniref:PAS domain-containing protein n=1 Tax=Olivibacter sp. SDN3 TaxID=2764720 RepID=UPI0016514747|nr:PAS domain-containing protein [Olivibacter sp. SDN3]QNL49930.1 PAS domain-containing protein [Olivibacter sp. SDN3]
MKHVDDNKFSFSAHSSNQELSLLLAALNTTKAGMIITDCSQPDNPIVYCNLAFEDLTGYSRDEVIGRNCRFLQRNDDNEEERAVIKQAISEGKECNVAIRNYKKDGRLFWNELHLKPIKNAQNQVIYYIGVQNDITHQRLVEQQLRVERLKIEKHIKETENVLANNNYLSAFLNTMNEALLILNEDLKITTASPSFLKMFHIAEDEVVNQSIYQLGNGRWDTMAIRNLFDKLIKQDKNIQNYLLEHTFPNVGKKTLSCNASAVRYTNDTLQIILAIEDISELKEIERRKDDFLSAASHELKTPLTTIMACLQLSQKMLPDSSDARLKNTLIKTKEYVDKLEHLITDLLDVSKIKSGKIRLSMEAFNLDAMIFKVVKKLHLTHAKYTFNISGFASNYYVGDKKRLEQVILNLLKNSVKFSPKGGNINIHLSRLSDFIKVAITDYGLGVDYHNQEKIFENFFRVDEIQKQYPGIGTGLYVSDQIIKNHGGSLWVESTAGQGATFSFTLPLKRKYHDKKDNDM